MGKYLNWIKKNILNENTGNQFREQITETKSGEEKDTIYISHMDKLFWEAGQLVIEKEKASIAMLQRYLKIGFNQALKIMNELCEAGVVGKEVIEGVTPRKILMSQEEFEHLRINGKIKVNAKLKNELDVKESQSYLSERMNMYDNKIDYMTGEDFEFFIAQLLAKIGFSNIQLTKGSGDQGVDIIAEKDNIKYAFQCKRYDKPVGNKAVQEVFAGKFFYRCHAAIVVTNNYFTKSAKKLAHENGVVLWDKDFLDNITNKAGAHFKVRKEEKKEINKEKLTETLKEIAEKINTVFKSFQVHTLITDIDYGECEVVFWLQPAQGVRVKTILSYKQEIEMELKIPIQMHAVSEKGRIGVFVLSKDLSVFMERKI